MMERSGVPVDASAVLPAWRQDAPGVGRELSGNAGGGGRGFLTERQDKWGWRGMAATHGGHT